MATDIRKPLESIWPQLVEARDAGLSESETVKRVTSFFERVLGYDAARELTREKVVKETFVDVAIKLGDEIPLLVEVVAARTPLRVDHIQEARQAAARDNVPFILLTNGLAWNLYHVTLDEDLQIAVAFAADLSSGVTDEAADLLALLHRSSVSAGGLRGFWEQRARLGPATLGRVLFAPEVLQTIRTRLLEGEKIRVDSRVLAAAIHEMLGPGARESMGPVEL